MAKNTDERSRQTIRSVEIAFNIVDALRDQAGMGVTELANELDHSKSTIHDHLQTLEEQQFVVRKNNGYRLTLQFLDITMQIREQMGNYDVVQSEADTLAEELGEVVQFGIEEHGRVSYLYKATGQQAVETRSRPGLQQPIHSTALGKAILAHLSSERVEEIIQSISFTQQTVNTISTREELRDELEETARRGYAVDDEENVRGLRCVAAPVMNNATAFGAISISGPSSRITDERIQGELADSVQRAANIIELNTKFS